MTLFGVGLNLYVAAIYTNIAVTMDGRVIPGILGIAGAALMLPRLRNTWWLGWLIVFLTASLLLGGSGPDMLGTRFPSWLQMAVALVCAHVLLCALPGHARTVRNTLLMWTLFITLGVAAESLMPVVQQISDSFRGWAFEGRYLYASDARDLASYGVVRPKLFAQEPSHVAKAFIVTAAGWYLLARKGLGVLVVCTVITTVFLRSPFVLIAVPLALLLAHLASGRPVSKVTVAAIPTAVAAALVFPYVFPARYASMLSGTDFSFFSRYQGPYLVAGDAIEQHPVFGVGIGAKEDLWEEMRAAYAQFFDSASFFGTRYLDYFNNAFANSLMFFGIAGAVVFYLLVAKWAASFGVRALVSLPVVVLFFQLDGALEGVRMWSSIALVWGCYMLANRDPLGVGAGHRVDTERREVGARVAAVTATAPSLPRDARDAGSVGPDRPVQR